MKRILVTGAAGFIGTSLVDKLLELGHDVVPLDKDVKPWTSEYIRQNMIKVDLVNGNIPDLGEFDSACLLAARQPHREINWEDFYNINAAQILRILGLSTKQVIYISSTTVNIVNGLADPYNYYGLSKALGERLLKINHPSFSQCSVIRFPSVMGLNHGGGIIHDMKLWIEDGREIDLFDMGERRRNVVHVNDAVNAIIATVKNRVSLNPFEEFNIGNERSNTLHEIVVSLMKMMKKEVRINLLERSSNSADVYVDNSNAKEKLGYRPRTIDEGMKDYLMEHGYEV